MVVMGGLKGFGSLMRESENGTLNLGAYAPKWFGKKRSKMPTRLPKHARRT